jgi:hypothetical protein
MTPGKKWAAKAKENIKQEPVKQTRLSKRRNGMAGEASAFMRMSFGPSEVRAGPGRTAALCSRSSALYQIGRIVALYYRSSTLFRCTEGFGASISEATTP